MSVEWSNPKCQTCERTVHSYTWVMQFQFVNGYRQPGMEECHLSCGCVLTMPSVAIEATDEPVALVTIGDFTGTAVLTFPDRFEEAHE